MFYAEPSTGDVYVQTPLHGFGYSPHTFMGQLWEEERSFLLRALCPSDGVGGSSPRS